MTDCKKASLLSGSDWTFVWFFMSPTWTKSYHANLSKSLRRFCDSQSIPKKRLFLSQARPRRHPRWNVDGRLAHCQRQCVSCKIPGHNGRWKGPQFVFWGWGFFRRGRRWFPKRCSTRWWRILELYIIHEHDRRYDYVWYTWWLKSDIHIFIHIDVN